MTPEQEDAFVKERCKRGLHVTIPIVREHVGDLLYASTCCDRLFAVVFGPASRTLQLAELKVDRDQLRELRGADGLADREDRG